MRLNLLIILFLLLSNSLCYSQKNIEWDELIEIHNEKNINTEYNEFSPAFWNNNILYLSAKPSRQNKEGFFDVFLTAETGGFLKQGIPLSSKINSPYHEGPVSFDPNSGRLYFTRIDYNNASFGFNKKKEVPLKIFYSEYKAGQWAKPKKLDLFEEDTPVCHPTLSQDGTLLIFAADFKEGYGKMDLYSTHLIEGQWSTPENLGPEINSKGNDWFPFLDENDFLFYSTTRNKSQLDIYLSKRNDTLWQSPIRLPEPMNSAFDDFGMTIIDRGMVGYLSSNRPGGIGEDDIYSFNSLISLYALLNEDLNKIKIQVTNEEGVPLAGAEIKYKTIDIGRLDKIDDKIYDTTSGAFLSTSTNSDGLVELALKGEHSIIIIEKKDMMTERLIISNYNASASQQVIMKSVPIQVIPEPTIIYKEVEKPRLNNVEVKKGAVIVLENIYYEYNDYQLTNAARAELMKLVDLLKSNGNVKIELSSHTDSRGKAEYNLELSKKRALQAKQFMITNGISPTRILTRGYGETKLRNHCADGIQCTESEHIYNRRTEIKVIE